MTNYDICFFYAKCVWSDVKSPRDSILRIRHQWRSRSLRLRTAWAFRRGNCSWCSPCIVWGYIYFFLNIYIYRVDAFVVYVCYMYVYMYVYIFIYIYISRIYTGVCVLNILLCLYICTRKLPPGILESPLPWSWLSWKPCAHAVGQLYTSWGDLTPLPSRDIVQRCCRSMEHLPTFGLKL